MSGFFEAIFNAKLLTHADAPGILRCVEELAKKAGTYTPKVYLAPTDIPNAAFQPATGRFYVTEGILDLMKSNDLHAPPSRELKAVLAHEMGHLKFRYSQFGPTMLLLGGLPLVGMGTMYIIDKTNKKIKDSKISEDDHPKAFWNAFGEVCHDMRQQGIMKTMLDFSRFTSPASNKAMGVPDKNIQDMSWYEAVMQQAKYLAVQAACLVPALAAVRPIVLRNEFQSDRFAVALTGNKEDFLSALGMLSKGTMEGISKVAHTPLQKNWADRVKRAFINLIKDTIMAHPPLAERVDVIKALDLQATIKSFHL